MQVLHDILDFSNICDLSIWAACLLGFFGLLRPGNFLCNGYLVKIDKARVLSVGQVRTHDLGYVVELNWSKTLQFREHKLHVPLPFTYQDLCPAMALEVLLLRHKLHGSNPDSPLLCSNFSKALNYKTFITRVNVILAQHNFDKISGHSFRRGGATWAFRAGLSGTMIQELGFWKSSAYLRYLEPNMASKFDALQRFAQCLPA